MSFIDIFKRTVITNEIIDDILDKVFVEIFGDSRKNPQPWFNQFVDWSDIKKEGENNEADNTRIQNSYLDDHKGKA